MRNQTVWGRIPLQWIVVDDGETASPVTLGQEYVRRVRERQCTGAESLGRNLLAGLARVRGAQLVIIEDDDWYGPTHLEQLLEQLARPGVHVAGDDAQRYYHVGQRCWRVWKNRGACLCQTGFNRALLPLFIRTVRAKLWARSYGLDGHFWRMIPLAQQSLLPTSTVVGIKGLPGRAGLGLGHRPKNGWMADPTLKQLREWIGADADLYADLYGGQYGHSKPERDVARPPGGLRGATAATPAAARAAGH